MCISDHNETLTEKLFSMQDLKYRDFQSELIPDIEIESMIGVRTPELRKFAKELIKSDRKDGFLSELPHKYFDENQLHALIISEIKDYDTALKMTENFLPYVDNWATCDQLRPKAFKKNKDKLIEKILIWVNSDKTYTVRFGIEMLMCHYLDDSFKSEYLDIVGSVRSETYYVNMMIAWYFATALAKQYEYAVKYIENGNLNVWVHNKTIQKACESLRVAPENKDYLKSLKR